MKEQEYQQDPLSAEEFHAWKEARTTKKVLYLLRKERKSLCDGMSDGMVLDMSSTEKTAMKAARIVGVITGLDYLLEMEVSDE